MKLWSVIFRLISIIGGCDMSYEIVLKWMSMDSLMINHCLSQCVPTFMSSYGATRPQWVNRRFIITDKNIERQIADTIVSWPNPKQWAIAHTSDLMMTIRQSIYILSIITRQMGKLKTYSPTYCIMDYVDWYRFNMLSLASVAKFDNQLFQLSNRYPLRSNIVYCCGDPSSNMYMYQ